MDKTRVLIVDDEPDFVRVISDVLELEGFQVTVAEDGIKGIKSAVNSRPDIILLDWNLPGKDGMEVCKDLKGDARTGDIPIVMLTAREREADVVLSLELGAADYVSKGALRPRELVARLRAVLRRHNSPLPAGKILRSGELKLDGARRRVWIGSAVVELRPKEFDLLYILLKNKSRVLTRHFLEESIWGKEHSGTSRVIDTTLARLKAKLGGQAKKIQSLQGLGYKFEEE